MNLLDSSPILGSDISVGTHITTKILGLTVNLDTIGYTFAALVIVIFLSVMVRRQATSGVPGRLQAGYEMIVDAIRGQVAGSIGPRGTSIIPLATALFIFILICNLFSVVGLGSKYEWLAPPTADIDLPAAMALFVIVLVHIYSIRVRGISGYTKHYLLHPFPAILMPINLFMNLIEEIVRPITLTLRLFGNLLSGGLMLTLIAALGVWKIGPAPIGEFAVIISNVVWKLFDLFIGAVQAFIFALLTILYFDRAMAVEVHANKKITELEPITI